jgi:hypothetical protein
MEAVALHEIIHMLFDEIDALPSWDPGEDYLRAIREVTEEYYRHAYRKRR